MLALMMVGKKKFTPIGGIKEGVKGSITEFHVSFYINLSPLFTHDN